MIAIFSIYRSPDPLAFYIYVENAKIKIRQLTWKRSKLNDLKIHSPVITYVRAADSNAVRRRDLKH